MAFRWTPRLYNVAKKAAESASSAAKASNPSESLASKSASPIPIGSPPPFLLRRLPRIASGYERARFSRPGRAAGFVWTHKRAFAIGLGVTYLVIGYATLKRDAYLRDYIHDDTYLVWKIHDGAIVECRSAPTLETLIARGASSGEDPPRVIELFEAIRTLKWAQQDPRIRGLFADFSSLHIPTTVIPQPLGLAQIEELVQAIHEFKVTKKEQHGADARSIAFTDSFSSQGSFLLATAFDEVWCQPSGSVPLTGLSAQIPFVKRALDWLGIKVRAEARRDYKSMVSTFVQEDSLPEAQIQNEAELLGELNRGMLHAIGVNRFPDLDPGEAADKVEALSRRGPLSAREAVQEGLLTGTCFRRELVQSLVDPEKGGKESTKFKTLNAYSRINSKLLEKSLSDEEVMEVGVVYLLGTISSAPGEFSASSVIKGLAEAGEDESIKTIVLRIDSGGGDVTASESIWDAVRSAREKYKKPVVASFGNASASGGYYAASAADSIVACENTITGSIGVASLMPNITVKFFDRLGVSVQSFFTGSTAGSTLHELQGDDLKRHRKHIDETYDDFLGKVCEGRGISRDVIEDLAGGRVYTGLSAWARCNPDAEHESASKPSDETSSEGAPDDDATSAAASSSPKVKAVSLSHSWKTREDKAVNDMSTVYISMVPKDQETTQKIAVTQITGALETAVLPKDPSSDILSSSSRREANLSEDDKLAEAAHEAAEESDPSKSDTPQATDSAPSGPYGRGLIDSIGGIWDSAYLAMSIALQGEVDALVASGLTLEQATQSVRPGCKRHVGEDGVVSLETDLRLVRFPEDKSWFQRAKELNQQGDNPTMAISSIFPIGLSLDAFAQRVSSFIVRSAVQIFMLDPNTSQRGLDPGLARDLGLSPAGMSRLRAEYRSHII